MRFGAYFINDTDGTPVLDPSKAVIRMANGVPVLGLDSAQFHVRAVGAPEERTLEFIGSDETVDRYREVLLVKGWDIAAYKKNPVFLFGHNYKDPPIGRSVKTWKDLTADAKALRFHIQFVPGDVMPFAEQIYQLYLLKVMNASSVGFLPFEWKETPYDEVEKNPSLPWRVYTSHELLELSGVPVPANPSALQNALSQGLIREDTVNRLQKQYGVNLEREIINLSTWVKAGPPEEPAAEVEVPKVDKTTPEWLDAHCAHCEKEYSKGEVPVPVGSKFYCLACAETAGVLVEEAPPVETPAPTEAPTEVVLEPEAASTKTVIVEHVLTDPTLASKSGRLILVSPEFMEDVAKGVGAVIEWTEASAPMIATVMEVARTLAKRSAFLSLSAEDQETIRAATPPGEMVDVLRFPVLTAKYVAALSNELVYADGTVEVREGAVLNKKNLARVKSIKTACEEILSEAEPDPSEANTDGIAVQPTRGGYLLPNMTEAEAQPLLTALAAIHQTRGETLVCSWQDPHLHITVLTAPETPAPTDIPSALPEGDQGRGADAPTEDGTFLEVDIPESASHQPVAPPAASEGDPVFEIEVADLVKAVDESVSRALAPVTGDVRFVKVGKSKAR